MLFTSLTFAAFFALFFAGYWFVFRGIKTQNLFLLLGSYVFYGWFSWQFLLLLIVSSAISYWLGLGIGYAKKEKRRSLFLWIGLIQGLGCLLMFKYYNFFVDAIGDAFHLRLDIYTLRIALPLGISFYTFRMLSYLLDIRSDKIKPTTDWVGFFAYIAFFPCLISGPIDRPGTLLPQLEKPRRFDEALATDGLRQLIWGLFKKLVIADSCALLSQNVFAHYQTLPAGSLLLGAFFATIQIYADFSGYSDMAIGLSAMIGFRVTRNFNYPFFSQNIADFWRRWHISLTAWFTDYVFMPLSVLFRDYGKGGLILAILINFTLIGIWHGANWTFILFGILNGLYFVPLVLRGKLNKKPKNGKGFFAGFREFLRTAGTFLLVMLTIVIFSADNITQAFDYLGRLLSPAIFSGFWIGERNDQLITLASIALLFIAERVQRDKPHPLQLDGVRRAPVRAIICYGLVLIILCFCASVNNDFIYFKF